MAEFIQKASEYKSSIWMEKDGKRANAKSMLGILALNITESTSISLIADGVDEEIAVKVLGEYISSNA
ncbi:MAG: HPr family phosphocarrier protein [Oscillospiraceae bacterium]|nr:HPr family phosphocarrier protein [Oscillospiraceae bacterium]